MWKCSARRLGLALGAEHQTQHTLLSSSTRDWRGQAAPQGSAGSAQSCQHGKGLSTLQGTCTLEQKKKTHGKKLILSSGMWGNAWLTGFLVPLPKIKITSETAYKGKFLKSGSQWWDWEEKEKSRDYKVNKIETPVHNLSLVVTHFFPEKQTSNYQTWIMKYKSQKSDWIQNWPSRLDYIPFS